jgi:hypothetical protein
LLASFLLRCERLVLLCLDVGHRDPYLGFLSLSLLLLHEFTNSIQWFLNRREVRRTLICLSTQLGGFFAYLGNF